MTVKWSEVFHKLPAAVLSVTGLAHIKGKTTSDARAPDLMSVLCTVLWAKFNLMADV